ncbi:DUF167 family protein [Enterovirga rhinocerotis]|uniref:UPF0235 protein EV668_2928 n=1 Tax=Enterovirga rhinocerotis TaxID=1339210 RepID=A0A4V3DXU4_9HYPH|nr:DUF167 family protein [Enterovirga rhinocerotis]TDR90089.1 hypothetical protein EV668_2928 [Enterovirga rhinocerotis]
MQDEPAFRRIAEGLAIRVRATPRGGRDAVEGIEHLSDGRAVLRIRVRAAAADGAANDALRRCLAAALGRPPSAVSVASGATARVKTLAVAGDPDDLTARLEALCAQERPR